MNNCNYLLRRLCLFLSIGLMTPIQLFAEDSSSTIQLWTKSPLGAKIVPSPQAIADYLAIQLDSESIEKLWDEKLKSAGARYQMTLPDGSTLQAYTTRVQQLKDGWIWVGGIDGDSDKSTVTLSYINGVLAGEIVRSNGKLYRVRFAGDDTHVIEELSPNKFAPGARPIEVEKFTQVPGRDVNPKVTPGRKPPPKAKRRPKRDLSMRTPNLNLYNRLDSNFIPTSGAARPSRTPGTARSCEDSGDRIDVLVVYTQKARITANGESAMRAKIALAIDETNQSYANSGILQRVNLVDSREVQYTEGPFVTKDLEPLQVKDDGVLDEVHGWRDQAKADIVVLITDNAQSNPCGVAFPMRSVVPQFEEYAFAAVPLSCATGQFNFAHELGHVMGADEDWGQSTNTLPFLYSHGLAVPSPIDPWRTIMAENTVCNTPATPNGCVRLKYWSNPEMNWNGQRMGVSGGSRPADNRRALNNTAKVVANFRRSCESP